MTNSVSVETGESARLSDAGKELQSDTVSRLCYAPIF